MRGLPPPEVREDERLARFSVYKKDVRANGTVRARLFLPPPDLKLSTCRLIGLSEEMVWNIGEEFVAEPRERSLIGRADFMAEDVIRAGLKFDPDGEPYPNHANIVGWPIDKGEQKEKAQMLAEAADYKHFP